MADGTRGFGTTLAGATTGTIGKVRDVNGFGASADKIDMTHGDIDSRVKEFVAGLIEAKAWNVTVLYTKAGFDDAYTAVGADNEAWTLTFPDGSTLVAQGFISDVEGAAPYNGEMTFRVTVTTSVGASGLPVFTPAV